MSFLNKHAATIIHITVELLVLFTVILFISKKNTALTRSIEEIIVKVNEQEDYILELKNNSDQSSTQMRLDSINNQLHRMQSQLNDLGTENKQLKMVLHNMAPPAPVQVRPPPAPVQVTPPPDPVRTDISSDPSVEILSATNPEEFLREELSGLH